MAPVFYRDSNSEIYRVSSSGEKSSFLCKIYWVHQKRYKRCMLIVKKITIDELRYQSDNLYSTKDKIKPSGSFLLTLHLLKVGSVRENQQFKQ